MTEADVGSIMKEIRRDIEENHYEESKVDFLSCLQRQGGVLDIDPPYCEEKYRKFLYVQSRIWDNQIEYSKGSSKSLIRFVGKCIKKVIGLVMNPWIASQNEFNATVVNTNFQLQYYLLEKEYQCKEMEQKIQQLEKRVIELESR